MHGLEKFVELSEQINEKIVGFDMEVKADKNSITIVFNPLVRRVVIEGKIQL